MSTAAETIRKHTCSRCLRRQCGGCTAPDTCQCTDAGHGFAVRRAGQVSDKAAVPKPAREAPIVEEPAPVAVAVVSEDPLDRLEWGEPRANLSAPQRLFSARVEAELCRHPGEWAAVGEAGPAPTISNRAHRLRKGLTVHGAGWDASRRVDERGGPARLYVRWVGEA